MGVRDAGRHHGGTIIETNERVTQAGLDNSAARMLSAGTICLSRTASVGYVVQLGREMATSQDFVTWTCSPALDPKYLMRALMAEGEGIRRFGMGTTHTTIYFPEVKAFHIALPPMPEQRRIVAKIDALSARSKRARADLERVEALAARARQSVLIAAYRGQLTEAWRAKNVTEISAAELVAKVAEPDQSRGGREATTDVKPGLAGLSVNDPGTPPPPDWAWVKLRRIARQETGHTPSRSHAEYWEGGVPWIGIRDARAHHGRIINETIQTISEAGLANSSARLLPAGTVCLSRTASVGYVTIMGKSMATSQDFATWTCTSAIEPEYLMYALMAEGDNIRAFGEGSTHTTIYFPEIRALDICLAPKREQVEVVRRVKLMLAAIEHAAEDARKGLSLLDRLDQSLLAKAFRGELVPQDLADEPASALLDRIRAERTHAPKQRTRAARSAG